MIKFTNNQTQTLQNLKVKESEKEIVQSKAKYINNYLKTKKDFFVKAMYEAFYNLNSTSSKFSLCFHDKKIHFLSSVKNIGQLAFHLGGDVVPVYSKHGERLIEKRNSLFLKNTNDFFSITKSYFLNGIWKNCEYDFHESLNNNKIVVDRVKQQSSSDLHQINLSASNDQNKYLRALPNEEIIILGIPGSGKTSTALERIAFLCDNLARKEHDFESISPNEILVLAKDSHLKNRLSETITEQFNLKGVEVCKLSEWISELARPFCHEADKNKKYHLKPFPFGEGISSILLKEEMFYSYLNSYPDFLKIIKRIKENKIRELKQLTEGLLKLLTPYLPDYKNDLNKLKEYFVTHLKYSDNYFDFSSKYKTSNIISDEHKNILSDLTLSLGRILAYSSNSFEDFNSKNLNLIFDYNTIVNNISSQKLLINDKMKDAIKSVVKIIDKNRYLIFYKLEQLLKHQNSLNISWKNSLKTLEKFNPAKIYLTKLNYDISEKWLWEDLLEIIRIAYRLEILFKRVGISKKVFKNYKHLFIDEFQLYNTNILLFVQILSKTKGWTFSGDLQQGVYSPKNSASIKYSKYLAHWKNSKLVHLKAGYRWTKQITEFLIETANKLNLDYEAEFEIPKNTHLQIGPKVLHEKNFISKELLVREIIQKTKQIPKNTNQNLCLICSSTTIANSIFKKLNDSNISCNLSIDTNSEVKIENNKVIIVTPDKLIGLEFDHVIIYLPDAISSKFSKNVLWICLTRAKISLSLYGDF